MKSGPVPRRTSDRYNRWTKYSERWRTPLREEDAFVDMIRIINIRSFVNKLEL
jgi:hypothetical protein